ncbi:hypothetical protein [Thermotalea metallivorans]|uniref:Uncharacterized protein n=1 Tax=Thermotalea metallivorans TaxID=520762 RepID=A0A140LEH8_9FIRM|nr:hypothetical protein [Thermotalea metallivorans]KXG78953.1 hypothetical protein AN619_01130 [Thermotalea metallivorans]
MRKMLSITLCILMLISLSMISYATKESNSYEEYESYKEAAKFLKDKGFKEHEIKSLEDDVMQVSTLIKEDMDSKQIEKIKEGFIKFRPSKLGSIKLKNIK